VEHTTLARALAGDDQAFRELTDPHRRELLVHCYRLLGSLTDAEDILQETLLAAWRGLAGLQDLAALRSWLYRIATNRCFNARRAAARRVLVEPVPPFQPPAPTRRGEITWLQPCPDALLESIADTAPGPEARYHATEAVELAFVVALQRMPPRQAAALVLRDVLGFSAGEVASMLDTSPTAVKGIVQRARASLDRHRGHPDRPALRSARDRDPRSARDRDLSQRFARAFTAGDVDGVVALLTDDAWLSMPPAPHEYQGSAAIAAFLHASFGFRGHRHVLLVPVHANTQPAFGSYIREHPQTAATPAGLIVLTGRGDRLQAITRFHLDALYPRFGLPASLTAPGDLGELSR
jgi:RNA polymerase sigma-70 factor (TIGR02960 family)